MNVCLSHLLARVVWFSLSVIALSVSQSPKVTAAEFASPEGGSYQSEDGTVSLVWREAGAADASERIFEVRRWTVGEAGEGTLIYEGSDTASFVSGLAEGDYQVRVRSKVAEEMYPEWDDNFLNLKVEYIAMSKVWKLMAAGCVTFLTLLATLFFGHRAAQREEKGEG